MNDSFKAMVTNFKEFEIDSDSVSSLDLSPISSDEYHLINNTTSYKIKIEKNDFENKEYQIRVNNQLYKVAISAPLDQLIKQMGFSTTADKQVNIIKAPMPGLILDINVATGDYVKKGAALLVLEAMKMENIISAPRDGVIKSINIEKGQAIDKGQLLIEFE